MLKSKQLTISSGSQVVLQASEGDDKPQQFGMVAYTGGKLKLPVLPYPVVIRLDGLDVGDSTHPVLLDHKTDKIVGHTAVVNVSLQEATVTVEGVLSGSNGHAAHVAGSSKAGFPWKSSISVATNDLQFIDRGQFTTVNGKRFVGPMYVARSSRMREVSFVPFGADGDTSASVLAAQAEEVSVFEEWLEENGFDAESLSDEQMTVLKASYDASQDVIEVDEDDIVEEVNEGEGVEEVEIEATGSGSTNVVTQMRRQASAELRRQSRIQEVCKDDIELQAKAIDEGWSVDKAELEQLRSQRPSGTFNRGADNPVESTVLEAAACAARNLPTLEDDFDEKVLDAAWRRFRGRIGLQELLLEAAWANGCMARTWGGNDRVILEAAFSTHEMAGILSNIANKFLLRGFNAVESTWRQIAAIRSVNDFKAVTSYRMTVDAAYEEVGPSGEIKHGTMGELSYTNQAKTYAKMLAVTRNDMRNDDLDALSAVPMKLGRGSAVTLNKVFWKEFLDNATFFTANRGNFDDSVDSTLSIDGLTAGEELFFDQTDPNGDPLGVDPAVLLVPNSLKSKADQLMTSTEVRNPGATSDAPTGNTHVGKFRVARSSYLNNAGYTGNSDTAWYLLANPEELATIEVAFLDGVEVPTVETADADFSTLGIQLRGFHDFGVAKQEFRAGVKMAGA